MPSGDRTGPMGQGPRTGRGMGYCNGNDVPGYANPGPGRGLGRGFGGGRGMGRGMAWGRGGYPMPTAAPAVDQTAALRESLDGVQRVLAELKNRLDALEGRDK